MTDLPVGFETLVGKARIIDAVHLDVDDFRMRLHGISGTGAAPSCGSNESGDICAAARKWLIDLVHGQETRCEGRRHSSPAPLIAVCSIKGRIINAEMVRAGLARADANTFPSYAAEESEARSKHIGLWRIAAPPAN
ncbi:MAG: thermonuclease family protein [Rhodospirillales bacterium]|nr:thermonuclease family protein [Rhodospirillales bacterium]